jgi:outer membrane autotransporter protein
VQRMDDLRFKAFARAPESDKTILLAFAGSKADLGQLFPTLGTSREHGSTGLWFNAFGQRGDQNAGDGYVGHEYTLRGISLGIDRALNDNVIAGLSAGISDVKVDLDDDLGDGTIETFSGRVYGSYSTGGFYTDAVLSYGRNKYENERMVTVGPIQRLAESDHRGEFISLMLGAGYLFDLERWLVEPFGSIRFTRLDEDGFTETGADDLSLTVDGRKTDALVSELGMRLARAWHVQGGIIVPEVSAAWLYDFDVDDRVTRASFAGAPDTSFSLPGRDVERHGLALGAGLGFLHKDGLSTSLKYRGEFRNGESSNGILGELGYRF